mgnify:CR=1 FL=1
MKTGTLYHFFNGESNILAVLSGSEPVITFSSIVDLDAMITEGKVRSLTINSQKVKDLFAGKYYSKEMRLNELSAVIQVIELEPSDEQKAQIIICGRRLPDYFLRYAGNRRNPIDHQRISL